MVWDIVVEMVIGVNVVKVCFVVMYKDDIVGVMWVVGVRNDFDDGGFR